MTLSWIDIKKRRPRKGIRVLACDSFGYVSIEDTDDVDNRYMGTITWTKCHLHGNGTEIVAWMPLPACPKALCCEDADGSAPWGPHGSGKKD